MKKYVKCFTVYCSILLLFAGFTVKSLPVQPLLQRQGANLVTNPDINGSTNWIIRSGMYDSSVSRDAGTGSFKMTITYPDLNYSYIESPLIPVTPGKIYTLAFYMRSDIFPPPGPSLYVAYYDSNQQYIRNSFGSNQSVTASASWQECVYLFRPQPGTVYAKIKTYFMFQPISYSGTVWADNYYLGEGIGFEQAPTAKTPFAGSQVRVDALGNMEVLKNGVWTPFFPLCICGDWNRTDWTVYSAQGFNAEMRANDVSALQRAKDAVSSFNPEGMMCGFSISNYISPSFSNYNNLTLLETKINAIKTAGLMDRLLVYYWDNENCYDEWQVPLAVTNKIKALDVDANLDRMHPIYALQGNEGIARKYNNSNVNMTDIVGDYTTCDISSSYPDETRGSMGLINMDNIEQQQNPVVFAQINNGVGLLFRPRLFNAIAKGAKAMSFWRDEYLNPTPDLPAIENQPWWNDMPNIRREIDLLLPIIRMPHWTTWSLSSSSSLIDFGTRHYEGHGYIIATNEQSSAVTTTFTLTGLPYTASVARNFFTKAIEANVSGSQFTVTVPAYGSLVLQLENEFDATTALKLPFDEASGSTTADSSYFGNDGTLVNDAALGNGTLALDGTGDRLDCGADASLEMGTDDITFTARIKLATTQSTHVGIITKGAGSGTDGGYAFNYRSDTDELLCLVSDGSGTRLWLNSNDNLGLKDNQWHTVAVSLIRSGNAVFYVDGVSVGSNSATGLNNIAISNSSRNLLVGSWINNWHLNGNVDNVRIYKKALTAQEITDLSEAVLYLSMNESNNVAPDDSIYGNDGIPTGDASMAFGMLNLDGTGDRLNCGADASLEMGPGDMTIVTRIKMAVTQNTYAGIVTKGAGSPADIGYNLVYYNNALIFMLSNGTTRLWLSSNSNLGLNDNQWHTVAVSLTRSGNAIFYVDGVNVGSKSASGVNGADISNSSRDLLVGSWINNWHLNGNVDNVRIYKKALTAQEISEL